MEYKCNNKWSLAFIVIVFSHSFSNIKAISQWTHCFCNVYLKALGNISVLEGKMKLRNYKVLCEFNSGTLLHNLLPQKY